MPNVMVAILARPGMAMKIAAGCVLVLALSAGLWSWRSGVRREVRSSLDRLSRLPPVAASAYRQDPARFPGADQSMADIQRLGEEAVPALFDEMEAAPQTRAWGLLSLIVCPIQVNSARFAPPLELLIAWLDDPDPAVAENAWIVLSGIFVVPDEARSRGPALRPDAGPAAGTGEEIRAREAARRRAWTEWAKWWFANGEFVWRSADGAWVLRQGS